MQLQGIDVLELDTTLECWEAQAAIFFDRGLASSLIHGKFPQPDCFVIAA